MPAFLNTQFLWGDGPYVQTLGANTIKSMLKGNFPKPLIKQLKIGS